MIIDVNRRLHTIFQSVHVLYIYNIYIYNTYCWNDRYWRILDTAYQPHP